MTIKTMNLSSLMLEYFTHKDHDSDKGNNVLVTRRGRELVLAHRCETRVKMKGNAISDNNKLPGSLIWECNQVPGGGTLSL